MKNMYTWNAEPGQRNVTVSDLKKGKGNRIFTQVTTSTADEAIAARDANIDLMICNAHNVEVVRQANNTTFLTAFLTIPDFPTPDDILRGALKALANGADAIMTARSMDVVSMLAREDIPVMGHLGLVPRKSTWVGGLRAVGKTADEAFELMEKFRRLEEAGAFAVEAEVIPDRVMSEITKRSGLITVSLGSGTGADVMYLFMEDICGEKAEAPRHARAFGNLHSLYEQIKVERVKALELFREASMDGSFPANAQTPSIDNKEFEGFLDRLK